MEVFQDDKDDWINKVKVLVIETHDKIKPGCDAIVSDKMRQKNYYYFESKEDKVFVKKECD